MSMRTICSLIDQKVRGEARRSRRIAALALGVVALFATIGAPEARAGLTQRYKVHDINGNQSPPPYGLRLDGFLDVKNKNEVVFSLEGILFDVFDDGTAKLHGKVEIVEVNNKAPKSSVPIEWNLDVRFRATTGPNSNWDYYLIDVDYSGDKLGSHVELTNVDDPTKDYSHLWSFPEDGSKPFQVGLGANGKTSNTFGASGWLGFHHVLPDGKVYTRELASSDFLMDLEAIPVPVPEPSTLASGAIGILLVGGGAWRRRRRSAG